VAAQKVFARSSGRKIAISSTSIIPNSICLVAARNAINIFALGYTAYVMVFLPFPSTLPVIGTNMNYALPIFTFTFFAALGVWVIWGNRNWKGLDGM
jgi:hypothetical protein